MFEALMYLSAAASIASYLLFWPLDTLPLALLAFWNGLWILFVWLAARRRKNWARCLIYFWFVTNFVGFLVLKDFMPPAMSLAFVAVKTLEAFGCYFAFTGESRQWFLAQGN
jgi:hypothetical protein